MAGNEFCDVVFSIADGLPPEAVLLVHDGQDISLLEREPCILGKERERENWNLRTRDTLVLSLVERLFLSQR